MARRLRSAAIAGMIAVALSLTPTDAHAAFPGLNGRLLLTWEHDTPQEVTTGELRTVDSTTARDWQLIAGCLYGCHHSGGDWSPDGKRVVYVNSGEEQDRLLIVSPKGTRERLVYTSQGSLSTPAWSPDGRRIAFSEYREVRPARWTSNLYVINRDGTHQRRLTDTPHQSEDSLDWSTRDRLVFSSSRWARATRRFELYTMRPDGTGRRRLTDNDVADSHPDWSPNGRRIVFVRAGQIWRMNAAGLHASRIATGSEPTWSPDGYLIAYVSSLDGAIHTVSPLGRGDKVLGSPVTEGRIFDLDWQSL